MLESHIEQLEKELDTKIPVDEKKAGVYHLSLDGDIAIDIVEVGHPHPPGWELKSFFGSIPHENHEQLFTKMLLGNLFGQGTRKAVLGLDEESKKLVLTLRGMLPMDYKKFHDHLEDFLNIVDMWKEEAKEER